MDHNIAAPTSTESATDVALAGVNVPPPNQGGDLMVPLTAPLYIYSTSSKLSTIEKATGGCISLFLAMILIFGIASHTNFTKYHTLSNNSILRGGAPEIQTNPAIICEPRARRFLIIISGGRSGSTSLMTMLDKLPHVRMSGENNNALLGIKKLTDQLKTIRGLFRENSGPWQHHAVPKDNLPCVAQTIMESINPPAGGELFDSETILGFKTIRFVGDSWKHNNETDTWEDVETAVTFVKHHFPCSRVVVNIRSDVKALAKSRGRLGCVEHAPIGCFEDVPISTLEHENNMLRKVAKLFEDQAYLVDSTEWASPHGGVNIINEMVEWLGFRGCTFNTTIHNNRNGYEQDSSAVELGEKCRFSQVNASSCW